MEVLGGQWGQQQVYHLSLAGFIEAYSDDDGTVMLQKGLGGFFVLA